jgi:hypothetical protein
VSEDKSELQRIFEAGDPDGVVRRTADKIIAEIDAEGWGPRQFRDAGTRDDIPLVWHDCPRYGHTVYVSAAPSPPGADYLVPGCGCRPENQHEGGKPDD